MKAVAASPEEYMDALPEERRAPMEKLRAVIKKNLDPAFKECIAYGMLGYVVPHSVYPAGYHCDPKLPLGFMNLASQKTAIVIHHLGIYADPALAEWFTAEYAKEGIGKLDMGKGCIRFKKTDNIPYELIGRLAKKYSAAKWIAVYEKNVKR